MPGRALGHRLPVICQLLDLRYLTEVRASAVHGLSPDLAATGLSSMSASQSPETLTPQFSSSGCRPSACHQPGARVGLLRTLRDAGGQRAWLRHDVDTSWKSAPVHFQTKQDATRLRNRRLPASEPRPAWMETCRYPRQAAEFLGAGKVVPTIGTVADDRRSTATHAPGADLRVSNLNDLVTHLLEPLQAELPSFAKKLAQGSGKRSNFEISLTQIPP